MLYKMVEWWVCKWQWLIKRNILIINEIKYMCMPIWSYDITCLMTHLLDITWLNNTSTRYHMTNDHIYYISRLMVKSIKYPMTNDHMSSFTRYQLTLFFLILIFNRQMIDIIRISINLKSFFFMFMIHYVFITSEWIVTWLM